MVMPYLNFTGDCEEAFLLYQRAFGVDAPILARYGDAPPDAANPLTDAQRQKIMHGHLMLSETGGISGADAVWPVEQGSAVCIHVFCDNVEKAQEAFTVLSENGTPLSPIAPNPPPHDNGVSGTVKDKYGFTWVLSAQL